LMIAAGPKFHQQTTIQSILRNPVLGPDRSMGILFQVTSNEDWAEAQRLYDGAGWSELDSRLAGNW
jgi:hypothetical protein